MPSGLPTYVSFRERTATALRLVERRAEAPTSVVMIATTPRTGSTLLGRTLGATGLVGRPEEFLRPYAMGARAKRWGVPRPPLGERARYRREWPDRIWIHDDEYFPFAGRSVRQYLLTAGRRERGPNGTFTLKVHYQDFRLAAERAGFTPDLWGVPVTWVRTRRRDRLAQAVSLVRAEQTRQFHGGSTPRGVATYDAAAIRNAMERLEQQERGWDRYLEEHDIAACEVVYEELDTHFDETIGRVLAHLGHHGVEVPPRATERQGDALNAEWIERFRRESGSG